MRGNIITTTAMWKSGQGRENAYISGVFDLDRPLKNSGRARFSMSWISSALNHCAAAGLMMGA